MCNLCRNIHVFVDNFKDEGLTCCKSCVLRAMKTVVAEIIYMCSIKSSKSAKHCKNKGTVNLILCMNEASKKELISVC